MKNINVKKIVEEEEDYDETSSFPVSPTGQYFTSSVMSISVICVLESEIPIDDSCTITLLKDVFIPINPRFSSIMVSFFFRDVLECPSLVKRYFDCDLL